MKVPWSEQPWNRVLVYGLGVSGTAAARLLCSRGVGVLGVDRRAREQLDLGDLADDPRFELAVGSEPESLPAGLDGVVLSPGVSLSRPVVLAAKQAGMAVVSEVELASRFARGPIVGITGSNGKSTTTLLTAELLRATGFDVEVCGNIGVPLSARVTGGSGRLFVTELSSFQLEATDTFRPRAAALLNFAPDHLDRHSSGDRYLAAKMKLFANQDGDDVAVLNADDAVTRGIEVAARRRFFSSRRAVEDGCYLDGDQVIEVDPGGGAVRLFHRRDLAVPGVHNLENAMAAALLSRAMGADPSVFPDAVARFRGLPHRLQQVRERQGVVWYDDSKATNFAATNRSLEGFADDTVHLILGGRNKGGDPQELVDAVRAKVRRVYLIGEFGPELEQCLESFAECTSSGTMEAAVEAAAQQARSGEVVLLSPACASFDQYRDFGQRGDHFQELVRALDG